MKSTQQSRIKSSCLSWPLLQKRARGPPLRWSSRTLACGTRQRLPGWAPGAYLQHRATVEVVGAGPSFQGGKGHVAPGERGNVAELICAQGLLLVASRPDEAAVGLRVGVLAGAAVVLVRDPGPVFPRALVNGEALRAAGVELEAHVCDVKCFSCWGEHAHVCKSCGQSEDPSSIPTLLWNSTKKEDTNHPAHTRPRRFQNTLHVGWARQATLSLEAVRGFPQTCVTAGLRSWLVKAHLWLCCWNFASWKVTVYIMYLYCEMKVKLSEKVHFILNAVASTKA